MNILLAVKHEQLAITCAEKVLEASRQADANTALGGDDGPPTAMGDPFKLRGIPVVGARGVGGAIGGSKPGYGIERAA